MPVRVSHIELNVSDYARSIDFYDAVLLATGWRKLVCAKNHTTYTDGFLKIVLCPTDPKHAAAGFHRKRTGLNHLALAVETRAEIDRFVYEVLIPRDIPTLYNSPSGDDEYYSVFFEDPDRMKVEIVHAPGYCEAHHYTNKFESDFKP